MIKCDVRRATHVQYRGAVFKIREKWGIHPRGALAKPSEGGFGCITTAGLEVNMYAGELYYREGRGDMAWMVTVTRVIESAAEMMEEDSIISAAVGGEPAGAGTFLPTRTRDQEFLFAATPDVDAIRATLAEKLPGRDLDVTSEPMED